MDRRRFLGRSATGLTAGMMDGAGRSQAAAQAGPAGTGAFDLSVSLDRPVGQQPHYWEHAGSDRAAVSMRSQWRDDLVRVRKVAGLRTVRCHGLFDDEMAIAALGGRNYNFLYLDQSYDFLLDNGVRPFVELGFMPEAYARSGNRIFSYRGNVSPPSDWKDWYDLVQAFTRHCVARYGANEVASWRFEVWNEPNLSFWSGNQADYFELYRQSALALKDIDARFQVGGPATAQLAWVPAFLEYCNKARLPVDFVSSHVYPGDPQGPIFGRENMYSFEEVMLRGMELVRSQIRASTFPGLPLWITEWSSQNPAFIAGMIKACDGLVEGLSYWTFSNVFEEAGYPTGVFNRTYGLMDQWGIARPSLHTFELLHRLGESRLESGQDPMLATRRPDVSAAILVWNLIPVARAGSVANGNPLESGAGSAGQSGASMSVRLALHGERNLRVARITQVSETAGSAVPAWREMGSPQYPSRKQLDRLRDDSATPAAVTRTLASGDSADLALSLPPNGVALIELTNR